MNQDKYVVTLQSLGASADAVIGRVWDTQQATSYPTKIVGPIPYDSPVGVAVRLGWIMVRNSCVPECWPHHCPSPDTHMRKLYTTPLGQGAAKKLSGEQNTRGEYSS